MSAVADKHIWATAEGKHVDAEHPAARFLVAAPGDDIPDEVIVKKGKTPRNKAVTSPDADKGADTDPAADTDPPADDDTE